MAHYPCPSSRANVKTDPDDFMQIPGAHPGDANAAHCVCLRGRLWMDTSVTFWPGFQAFESKGVTRSEVRFGESR